jgi:hypothetical protein
MITTDRVLRAYTSALLSFPMAHRLALEASHATPPVQRRPQQYLGLLGSRGKLTPAWQALSGPQRLCACGTPIVQRAEEWVEVRSRGIGKRAKEKVMRGI